MEKSDIIQEALDKRLELGSIAKIVQEALEKLLESESISEKDKLYILKILGEKLLKIISEEEIDKNF